MARLIRFICWLHKSRSIVSVEPIVSGFSIIFARFVFPAFHFFSHFSFCNFHLKFFFVIFALSPFIQTSNEVLFCQADRTPFVVVVFIRFDILFIDAR